MSRSQLSLQSKVDEQTKENVMLKEQLKEVQDKLKAVTEIKEKLEQ